MKSFAQHESDVRKIASKLKEYASSDHSKKVRFYHGGTHSTRKQEVDKYFFIDISHLNEVIEVKKEEKYALVEPNVSMDKLVSITLEYGLIPSLIMEFPGITVGGGVNGATIESSSFKHEQLNDICEEYEVVLGDGEIKKISRTQNDDLFYGITGTYGTLCLLTLIKVRLINAPKFVHVTFYPTKGYTETLGFIESEIKKGEADYIEGIVFDKNHSLVILGKRTNESNLPIKTFSKNLDTWFYEHAKLIRRKERIYEELIPIVDYEFRYNRGAFWMADYGFPLLHIPNNRITRFLLSPVLNTRKLYDALHALNVSQNYFIQDFYCPMDKALDLLNFSGEKLGIFPIWLCPMKSTKTLQKLSPDYNPKSEMLIDVGVYGQSKKFLADTIGLNREFEKYCNKINARKMLYAHSYYTEEEFWEIYDKDWYEYLRTKYKAKEVFPDIWDKVHVSEKYKETKAKGILKVFLETLLWKHINS